MLSRLSCITLLSLAACAAPGSGLAELPEGVQCLSLTGRPLVARPLQPEAAAVLQERVDAARARVAERPEDPDAWVWLGRRLAYMGEFRAAIEVYTQGLARHPEHPALLRHRGHRYISVREFRRAVADLSRAEELLRGQEDVVEPDGDPARALGVSTLQQNVWYHLGLAHWLLGDVERAAECAAADLQLVHNADSLVSGSYWRYLALRRLGRDAEAERLLHPISAGMPLVENDSYRKVLLVAKGELTEAEALAGLTPDGEQALEFATIGYGVAVLRELRGDRAGAERLKREIEAGAMWPAFGHIAAEAELARGAR